MKKLILILGACAALMSCSSEADEPVFYRASEQSDGTYQVEKVENGDVYVLDHNLTYEDAQNLLSVLCQL